MKRKLVDRVGPPLYAVVDFAVIMAPSIAVKNAADRGGMGDTPGLDLVIGSLLVGTVHAVTAGVRLQSEERIALRRADTWIAALNSLVVLALGATLLLLAILEGFADEHSSLANRDYPVILLWIGVQVLAVACAEGTRGLVFWWLEPERRQRASKRRRPRLRRSKSPDRGTSAPDGGDGVPLDVGVHALEDAVVEAPEQPTPRLFS
ncbi:MAG TPA: hypothetical protein VGQ20_08440 [Acidimicrobiales bacterium]|jgi:hypothetical protein|nr:hypothetical protein [Acidimicrobiales bacterium]